MYALHRLPRGCARFAQVRGNATLQAAAAASEAANTPPPPAPAQQSPPTPAAKPAPKPASAKAAPAPAKAQETAAPESDAKPNSRRVWPTRRPPITLERPRQYMRPIGKGVLPAYDHALEYIKKDAGDLKKELHAVKAELEKAQASEEPEAAERVAELQEKVSILEVQSEINLPSVRWKARNGLADMTRPVYRHLIEQRWRQEGALDLVMERVHQMGVVPDLLPDIRPSIDLRVNFPERLPEKLRKANRTKRSFEKVEAGVYLLPEQTRKRPMLYTTVFHTEPRLYTLLMFDLDVPDPENNGFQTYLHWMEPNIELSTSSENPLPRTSPHTPYIPPHPQRGTPYHRYALMLVAQQDPTKRIEVAVPTKEQRLGFSYRQLAAEVGLDATKGGGIFMWREIWDETVSRIYAETLKTEEPVFGKPPKADPYDYFKVTPKYATASA
ncbi:PEBP-like protein [Phanerochaete sordida]|uniref:PEBP-like protein n=1 Tax=Phanerochaete sordida TaxID=48140 RepID=A0A9P3GIE9_9APHY|nr:PEBP-like protein [Phanerochaete sordida]